MNQRFLQVLQIFLTQAALVAGLGMTQPAEARPDCPGFQANRTYRERNDREAPLLPRTSIAAIAIQSPDGCDRSSEENVQQPSQTTAPQSQQSVPVDEAKPASEQPAQR